MWGGDREKIEICGGGSAKKNMQAGPRGKNMQGGVDKKKKYVRGVGEKIKYVPGGRRKNKNMWGVVREIFHSAPPPPSGFQME